MFRRLDCRAGLTGWLLLWLATASAQEPLAPGETRTGTLAAGDPTDRFDGGLIERVPLEPGAARLLRLELRSEVFDAFLILRGEDDMVLAVADDIDNDGGNFDARLDFEVPDGPLVAEVGSAFGNGHGPWELSLEAIESLPSGYGPWEELADQLAEAADLEDAPTGRLGTTSLRTPDGNRFEVRRLEVEAGRRYDLRLFSGEFDAYLAVLDVDRRRIIGTNDDDLDGDGTHARLRFEAPEDGVLAVIVDSFEIGERGAFRLELARDGP